MDLIPRVQNLVVKPKDEWVKIKGEDTPPMTLILSYAAILAAIPAIAQFIGFGLIGIRVPFLGAYRYPLGSALLRSVLYYVFTLASVYGFGFVINLLAPNFGTKPNLQKAMQLAVYSMTIPFLAGIFYIIPSLGVLAGIVGLYGLYVLYLGFNTPMMDTPKDKLLSYLVVSIVVIVVLMLVVGLILGAVFAVGSVARF
ncbi:MAG: Yip1 family protein [Acidobacteriota bacterium]|nr:Yip1 family protein [Acidobacteriota bacterium]